MELYQYSITDLHKMLTLKQCSAMEITQSVYERIQSVEEKVQSYITLCQQEALEQARKVDEKIANNESISVLSGIPIGIKDNICTKDVLTSCGSKILSNFVPPYDATVMEKLHAEDIVMTGKLNMDEFAMGSSTESSHFKKTANPHDLTRVPGGSSGGSAAAVAAGECIGALGTDTGGSIRQPSAFCGTVGLKPTYGSVSRYGLVAFASSLDQIGPITRTVADTAVLYEAICGYDPKDATSENREYPSFLNELESNPRDLKGLTVGLPKEYFGEGIDKEVRDKVLENAKLLEAQGTVIKEISLPSTDYALSAYYIIASAEASSNLARFDGVKYGYRSENYDNLTEMYENTRSEGFGDEVKRRIMLGTFVLSSGYYDAYYKRAKVVQKRIVQEFDDCFQDIDVILTPTTPQTAFKLIGNIEDPVKMYAGDICTVTVNIAGLPAISIPCGKDSNNMPIGMQLIGPKFSEQMLLNTAYQYEQLVGGFNTIASV